MFETRFRVLLEVIQPIAIFALLALAVSAQDSATGSIRGVVLDPGGARLPQASIAIVNNATSARYFTTSDAEGHFALEMLAPGDYSARVESKGISPEVTPSLHVDVGGTSELHFRLALAGAQESVTVSAAPALVETKPSAVSTLLDERSLNDIPLNGRRFSDLTLLGPGVTQDPRGLTSSNSGDLSFGGIRGFQNTFLVDGGDYNNAFFAQARGRYRAPYVFSTCVLDRSCAGISGVLERLRRRTRTLWRCRDQRGHQIRIKSRPRYRLLLSS